MTATAPTKETILVVDDEASIRRILETRLSMIGYNVVTACDGTEALELFPTCTPDLVVLDVMMPKLDGYGVCQELRKESDVPIVMLTALGDVADRITGLELGADDYVVKPFSPKELEARIRCVLRRVEKEQVAGIPNSGVIQADGGPTGHQVQMSCRTRSFQGFVQPEAGGGSHHPVDLPHEADLQRQPVNGIQASLQDRPRRMVTTHAIDGHPEALRIVDLIGIGAPLQPAQGIEPQRLEHGACHRACSGDHGFRHVAGHRTSGRC